MENKENKSTIKSNKQNKKLKKWKGEIKKKNIQVTMKRKVKLVSAVVICLLSSFWICLCFSHSSRSDCLTLKKINEIEPPDDFKPAKQVLHAILDPAGKGGDGLVCFFFFFSCVSLRMGAGLGYKNHRCPVSSPCPQSALGQLRSPSERSLSGSCYLSDPLLPTFDQSVRCPEWEQIDPHSSLFAHLAPEQVRILCA